MKSIALVLPTSHVPMLSQPGRVADFIAQAAASPELEASLMAHSGSSRPITVTLGSAVEIGRGLESTSRQ